MNKPLDNKGRSLFAIQTQRIRSVWDGSTLKSFLLRLYDHLRKFFKSADRYWLIVVAAFTLLVYILTNLVLPGKVSPSSSMYLIQPLLWLFLGSLAGLGLHFRLKKRLGLKTSLLRTTILFAFFQIAVLFMAGIIFGFGYSPYNHSLGSVIGNLFYVLAVLAGLELIRAYIIIIFGKRNMALTFILATVVLSFLNTPFSVFLDLTSVPKVIQTVGERFLPELAENLFATLIVFIGGPAISMIYRMILHGFEWLSPILPNLNWFVKALLGTFLPAFGMILVYNWYFLRQSNMENHPTANRSSFTSWAVVSIISLVLLGINTGLFGIQPSLIASGSMTPEYAVGDIVITRKVAVETIKVGDVISYQSDGVLIIHRVISITNNSNQITFITQGDANTSPDDSPVSMSSYQGKVVTSIPKLGWVSIFIRNMIVDLRK